MDLFCSGITKISDSLLAVRYLSLRVEVARNHTTRLAELKVLSPSACQKAIGAFVTYDYFLSCLAILFFSFFD